MSIRVISGDATLVSRQACRTSCTTARNGRTTCTTTCTDTQEVELQSSPSASRGSPDVVDDLFLGSGPIVHFNPYVVGAHKISSAISIGHAEAGWSTLEGAALQAASGSSG